MPDNLSSERGIDYTNLRNLLKAGKWKEADEETLAVMLKEGWLRLENIQNFPCTDFRTIDTLWIKYSNGRFGFSVHKQIWESVGGTPDADYETYCHFGELVQWYVKKRMEILHVFNLLLRSSIGASSGSFGRGFGYLRRG